jgi:hypothetical protein
MNEFSNEAGCAHALCFSIRVFMCNIHFLDTPWLCKVIYLYDFRRRTGNFA